MIYVSVKKLITKTFALFVMILGATLFTQVSANSADINPIFDTRTPVGFNNIVYSLMTQNDGKILAGGTFSSYKGTAANYLVRLNADGTIDSSFNIGNGFNSTVYDIKIQNDGKILVGGQFTSYSGTTSNRLIRLHANGLKDTSFIIGSGFNGIVQSVVIQSNGKILVGGQFTSYNGLTANKIIRLNSDGSVDTNFTIGSGFDGTINTLAIQNDGKILVGGQFTSYDGSSANRIIRLNSDGSVDTNFTIGSGFNNTTYSLTIQNDGKILVGGIFTSYNGSAINRIIRLNSDGTKDTSFIIGGGFNNTVTTVGVQSDGKILVGGVFISYSGATSNKIIRLNSDGTKDTSFIIGSGFNGTYAYVIRVQQDGKILVGGDFTIYNGAASKIIRLNSNGTKDSSFSIGDGFDNAIYTLTTQSDGKILVGGQLTTYDGIAVNKITRINADGTKDSSFNIGNGFNGMYTYSLDIQSDGKILVGGDFTSYDGSSANRIIRLNSDGTRDTEFTIGSGFDGTIYTLLVQSDGKILVGGQFTSYDGSSANRIIRLNSDGTKDMEFTIGGGFNSGVLALGIQSDGKILVGGQFTSYDGSSANRIIRLNSDGTRDTEFTIGSGFNNGVKSFMVGNGGKILVGGNFTLYSGSIAKYLIRLNNDGTRDSSFTSVNGFNSYVYALAIQGDGKLLVGGNFTSYNGVPAGYLVGLYGDSDLVILPNSTNTGTITTEFTSKGYTQSNGDFVGSTAISLSETDGNIPSTLSIKNENITLSIPAETQFKQVDNITNYNGIISAPIVKTIASVNDESVATAFKVGSSTESINLVGGIATLLVPVPGETIGDMIQIYYSEDNGVTWYPQVTTLVIDHNGQPYIEFTTDHFTDFAVTLPAGTFTGTFVINNDAPSTNSGIVLLNISATPPVVSMRFSDNGVTRPDWESYSTTKSRTLPGTYGSKTIYAQFDVDGDNLSDAEVSDDILYNDGTHPSGGECGTLGNNEACISLEISGGNFSCSQYPIAVDFGTVTSKNIDSLLINDSRTSGFICRDMAGQWATPMTVQSDNLTGSSNAIIPSSNITWIPSGSITPIAGDCSNISLGIGGTLDAPVEIITKNGPTTCDFIYLPDGMTVNIPAYSPVESYIATMTITNPTY